MSSVPEPTGPNISICIPVYNGALYLDASIRSARDQTESPREIVVVDDGSTDGSLEIMRRHASEDARVRVVANSKNLGLTGNWFAAVEQARGSWIKFLFQDDLLHRDCLRVLSRGMRDSGAAIGFVGRHVQVSTERLCDDRSGTVAAINKSITERNLARLLPGSRFLEPAEVARLALEYWSVNVLGEPTSAMLRRDLFARYGPFDGGFTQICDLEYWLRVGVNEGLWFETEQLATFRLHGDATSIRNQQKDGRVRTTGEMALLGCKFLHDPAFEAVRREAVSGSLPVDLQRRVARHVFRLRLQSRSSTPAESVSLAYLESRFGQLPEITRSRAWFERALHRSPDWVNSAHGAAQRLRAHQSPRRS